MGVYMHNREIAVKKVQASRVVYCELIGDGESTKLIKKTFLNYCQDRRVERKTIASSKLFYLNFIKLER